MKLYNCRQAFYLQLLPPLLGQLGALHLEVTLLLAVQALPRPHELLLFLRGILLLLLGQLDRSRHPAHTAVTVRLRGLEVIFKV